MSQVLNVTNQDQVISIVASGPVGAGSGGATTAADVAVVDAGGLYSATNVETALAEVKSVADSAAGGGVTLAAAIEGVQDDLGNTSLVAGTSLTKVYDDGANTITLNVDAADFDAAGSAAAAQAASQPLATLPTRPTPAYPADCAGAQAPHWRGPALR